MKTKPGPDQAGHDIVTQTGRRSEELLADLGKTPGRLHRDRGVEEQILELTRQKEMYHSVFENTGTGTIIIDPDMLILYVNAGFLASPGTSGISI